MDEKEHDSKAPMKEGPVLDYWFDSQIHQVEDDLCLLWPRDKLRESRTFPKG